MSKPVSLYHPTEEEYTAMVKTRPHAGARSETWDCGCGFDYMLIKGDWLLINEAYCGYANRINEIASREQNSGTKFKYKMILMIHRNKRQLVVDY